MACLQGPLWEVKVGCRQRERQDVEHMPLLGSAGECFGVTGLKSDWLFQTKKSGAVLSFTGSYLRETLGDRREYLSQGSFGKSCPELTFTCDSEGCYLGLRSQKRLVSVQGPYRLLGHTKWMLRQQYQGVV